MVVISISLQEKYTFCYFISIVSCVLRISHGTLNTTTSERPVGC